MMIITERMPVWTTGSQPPTTPCPVATCTTIEEVVAEMTRRWQRLHRAGDWREVFAQTYLQTTKRIGHAVQQNRFENPEWMVRLDCLFAQFYFNAIDSWEVTGRSPLAWQVAFDYARRRRTMVLQDVLLGMNAHINNDLPYVLHYTIPLEATETELASYYRDHKQLDVVLAESIDTIQTTADDLDPTLTLADLAVGRHDEKGFAKLVSLWRTHAWSYFLLLRSNVAHAQVDRLIANSAHHYALLLLQFQHVAPQVYWPNRLYRQSVSWIYRQVRR